MMDALLGRGKMTELSWGLILIISFFFAWVCPYYFGSTIGSREISNHEIMRIKPNGESSQGSENEVRIFQPGQNDRGGQNMRSLEICEDN